MPLFDPRFTIVLGGAMGLLMALVLFFMHRGYPVAIGGLRQWTAAPLLLFLSAVFFGLRGHIPDVLSILLANVFLYAGSLLYYLGSQHFFGRRAPLKPWLVLGAVVVLMLIWLSHVDPRYGLRLALFNAALLCVYGAHCRLFLRQGRLSFASRFMLAVLVLQAATLLTRIVSVIMGNAGHSLLDPSMLQNIYIAVYCISALSLSIGVVLMATDAMRAEFERLAAHDPMTGALSRTALITASQHELARCQRHGRTMSILLIDLDHFKTINDTYGHQMGDQVLVHFVRCTQGQLRAPDRIGRYGGEEFLVLLPETGLQAAAVVAERIRAEVATPHAALPAITISIGIASNDEGHAGDTVDTLIHRADQSMYRAKAYGRNRTEWEALL